jgi:UDP-glucuronate decarboxylase
MVQAPAPEKKNILVTGGAGFIGSHLCEALLKEGRVICLDNFMTSEEGNINDLLRYEDFEFIRHDLSVPFDPENYPELARFKVKFQGLQEIYHLACPTSPKKFDQYKMQSLYANSLVMKNVLDLAVRFKSRVVHASSAVVYGSRPSDNHLLKEQEIGASDTLSARACYDEGKRFAEAFCATYAQVQALDVRIARIFRTYGPRMTLSDGHMVPDFIMNALDGKALEIFGDETFRTSLIFVTDVVDGLVRLMKTAPAKEGMVAVNLGSDQDFLLKDVGEKIIEMTKSTSKITYKPALLFMSELGLPDLSFVKDRLGWIPIVTLEEGIRRTVEYTVAHRSLLNFRSLG